MNKNIVIYGASSANINPIYKQQTYTLGGLLARAGYGVVCGGGRSGLMAAAIEGAVDAGGNAIGVLPRFMAERNWQHSKLSKMIVADDMHHRKKTMAQMSIGAIACPGGCGTLEELLEIITWRKLRLWSGHIVILNTLGFYDPLIEMLQRTIEQNFMNRDHHDLWLVARTAEEAAEMVTRPLDDYDFSQTINA